MIWLFKHQAQKIMFLTNYKSQNIFQKYSNLQSVLMLLSCLLLTACSNSTESFEDNAQPTSTRKVFLQHIHPATKCDEAFVHSHPGGEKEHQHNTDCKGKVLAPSNAHEHPATDKRPAFRHIHPNGANEHSHDKD